ncbi:putative exported protein [Minicystis rosea]|nr:putative exported protein [Minicystis rosea]
MSRLPVPKIPAPRLQLVRNLTPFALFQCDKMGVGRRFHDTVVLKGSFALAQGVLKIASDQAPIELADDYWDLAAPERSSVKRAGDVVLTKPGTDVIITGSVRARRPLRAWDVAVRVEGRAGVVIDYGARVTGPREWRYSSVRGWVISDPEPTAEVPIRYELAYGGAYLDRNHAAQGGAAPRWIVHAPNPSGTGFFDVRALNTGATYRAPQWEPIGRPVTTINEEVPLTGFGPISRPWSARVRHVGTYDAAWEQAMRADAARGLPMDYAADFDARFFQCAHPSLVTREHLRGDETVALAGMISEPDPIVLQLPGLAPHASLVDGRNGVAEERLPLDTVHVDLDAGAVHLCWRLTLDQARDIRSAVLFTQEGA